MHGHWEQEEVPDWGLVQFGTERLFLPEVWAGAGTHDIGFARDKRNGRIIHRIDLSGSIRSSTKSVRTVESSLQNIDKVKNLNAPC
jgi:hypothetical protein